MPNLNVNGIDIAYETYGDVGGATIVMIQGLGMPLIAWPPPIIERLTEAGYHVVAMDNRDIGLSETFHDAGVPNLAWQWFRHRIGLKPRVLYGLKDMAQDVASLMARLDIHNAHVVGVSMGGMIGQRLAIDHGGRVSSLVSIMSTTGNPRLPRPEPEVLKKLLQRPRTDDIEDRLAHSMGMWQLISSPGFEVDFDYLEERLRNMYARGMTRGGIARQMLAIGADGDRRAELRKLDIPTLVIHGKQDRLVPVAAGIDTADAIPDARLELIEGMGHDLPVGLHDRLSDLILAHVRGVEHRSSVAGAI